MHAKYSWKKMYLPALANLIRNIAIIITPEVIQNILLQARGMQWTIATVRLLANIHCKDCCMEHSIQFAYLTQREGIRLRKIIRKKQKQTQLEKNSIQANHLVCSIHEEHIFIGMCMLMWSCLINDQPQLSLLSIRKL